MWFSKKPAFDFVDMHCHILPGIDDGAKDENETLEMLRIAYDSGIRHMIATPHYKQGHHNAEPDTIQRLVRQTEELAAQSGCPLSIYPGNEILYFDGMSERVAAGEILTMNGTDRVLVEFLPNAQYSYIRNAMDDVLGNGYTPILAHIERYECFLASPEKAYDLTDMGVEIQANASSLAGKYGHTIQKFLFGLAKDETITYVGTDAHGTKHRVPNMEKCKGVLQRKVDEDYLRAILFGNAYDLTERE